MLERMGHGDDTAWHWFTVRYDSFVRAVLGRSIWPEARLVEATSDFWAFAFEQRLVNKHEPTRRFRAFLSGCLANFSRKWLQKNRPVAAQATDSSLETPDPCATPDYKDQSDLAAWAEHLLKVALNSLDADPRSRHHAEVVRLFYGIGTDDTSPDPLSGSQIASRFGIAPNAVHVRLNRARSALRQHIEFEVQQTVGSPDELEEELAHILSALGTQRPGLVECR